MFGLMCACEKWGTYLHFSLVKVYLDSSNVKITIFHCFSSPFILIVLDVNWPCIHMWNAIIIGIVATPFTIITRKAEVSFFYNWIIRSTLEIVNNIKNLVKHWPLDIALVPELCVHSQSLQKTSHDLSVIRISFWKEFW